jgi:hypothetical protein
VNLLELRKASRYNPPTSPSMLCPVARLLLCVYEGLALCSSPLVVSHVGSRKKSTR